MSPVALADEVKVSYNNIFATSVGGILTDAAGNYVPLFSSQNVRNNASVEGFNLVSGPKLTPLEMTIQEGDTGRYTVALDSEPSESVTVKILPYQTVQVSSYELTFTTENWDEPQEVTVTTYGDNDSVDAWAAVLHYTEGVANGNWTFVRIVVDDQDTPLVVAGNSAVSYAENGATEVATYSVPGESSIRWSLLGEDKDRFSISAGGVLSFHSPPDFEQPADHDDDNIYRVFIHAASGSSTGFLPVAVAVTEPPSTDASLRALTLEDDGANALALHPVFATATTSYAVLVANSVSEITLSPSTTDSSATVQYLNEDNAAIADADGAEDDHQVSLTVGDNTIKLRVTAESTTTTQTYTVVVTRLPPADTTPPTFVSAETDETGEFVTITFSEDIFLNPLVLFTEETTSFDPHFFVRGVLDITIDGRRDVTEQWFALDGRELTLQVERPLISSSQTVRVSYNNILANSLFAVGTGLFLDAAGNAATTFSDQGVTNRSTLPTTGIAPAGPEYSVTGMTLAEGAEGTFTVTLPSQPPDEVKVSLFAFPANSIDVTTPDGKNLYGASVMTFDQDNWDAPQTATLVTRHDSDSVPAWAYVYGFIGEGSPDSLRSVTSFFVLIIDDDPPLTIAGSHLAPFPENGTGTVATYSVEGGASWSLHGPDKGAFSINRSTGALSFKSPPDFEQPSDVGGDNVYVVYLLANRSPSTGFLPVVIQVTNGLEPPVFASTSTTREVPENSLPGTEVGEPVAATDDLGDTPTHTLAGMDAASFEIDATSGQILTKSGVTYDHETKSSYSVTVEVSDGKDANGDADTLIDDSIAVTIAVTDVNEDPAFPVAEMGQRRVNENVGAGTSVGAPVSASDEDGDRLTYTLTGAAADSFEIVSTGGQIRTKLGETYDHETNPSYFVIVNVSDGKDPNGNAENPRVTDASLPVTITIDDVDEQPDLTGPVSATYRENDSDVVARYSARDPEGATITWSLSGNDHSLLEIDSAGVVEFVSPPDFEAPRGTVYRVAVEASDSDVAPKLTTRRNLVVTVTDENEPPVITSSVPSTLSHDENRTGTVAGARFTANDPDVGDTIRWSLGGSDHTAFTITNGVLAFDSAKPAPDHEAQHTYQVTVEATSGANTVTQPVTVTINDLEEDGKLTLPPQPQVDASYEATFIEGDDVTGESWQWASSTSGSGGWDDITGATGPSYTPVEADVNHYLRITIEYNDGHGQKDLEAVSRNRVQVKEGNNTPPTFPNNTETRSVNENATARANVGNAVTATDIDADDILNYELSGSSLFTIDSGGQIRVAPGAILNHEAPGGDSHIVTVIATDPSGASASTTVTIEVADVNEAPVAEHHDVATREDMATSPTPVLFNDSDPDEDDILDTLTVLLHGGSRNGNVTLNTDNTFIYTPSDDYDKHDSFTYRIRDDGNLLSNIATVTVTIDPVNDPPTFPAGPLMRTVGSGSVAETDVGAPVAAADIDQDPLEYSLSGGNGAFEIDRHTGQIKVTGNAPLDTENPYMVTVTADDQNGGVVDVEVTITVTAGPVTRPAIFVGGGGGASRGPTPSEVDFEWTVKHDIDELDASHDKPTGMWSDGTILWLAHNGDGADDAIYAYDIETGERVEDREFELDERNRAPRGVWSDGTAVWVSDSGRERLFAHDLATGERLPERDIVLADRNSAARGIWSGDETMWVLDGGKDSIFAYDLEGGALLAEYALHDDNDDARGLWSDRVTVWISNHDPKRLFAYRLPARSNAPAAEDADGENLELERSRDEEFAELSKASNNSPRGIWSDGQVMYVADENDGRVYSYNMPDSIDARLASLTLSGVEIGEFDPGTVDYEGAAGEGVTQTTVEAEAAQSGATIVIDPPDADEVADGHQVALGDLGEITVTVTSEDLSRTKVYLVRFGGAVDAEQSVAPCLRGAVTEGFSLVVYAGGSVEYLVACAEDRNVTAIYAFDGGEYVSYILGAPEFVNEGFLALFAGGVPALTPLVAKSEGPPSPAPASDDVLEFGSGCLRGEIAVGFSLVLYEGGDVNDLDTCAQSASVSAVYALVEGEYVPYILGAPEFVNSEFGELFADGLPPLSPLAVKSDGPLVAGAGGDVGTEN